MTEAQRQLVLNHLPWARAVVSSYVRRVGTAHIAEDQQAAGAEALVRAAIAYEPDRGVPFRSYAYRRVEGAAVDVARGDCAAKGLRLTVGKLGPGLRLVSSPARQEDSVDLRRAVNALAGLPRRTRAVITLTAAGNTLAQAGAVLGVDRSWACRERKAGREALIAAGVRP